jgi:hypothetical protein
MKKRWLVKTDAGQEHIEANEVEITPSGVLAFYQFEPPIKTERILLTAFASSAWQRCELEPGG